MNIKHVFPAPLHEISTFSGVSLNSLKTLLVLSRRGILSPSPQLRSAMACVSLPGLVTASHSGSRISLWAAVLATTTLLRIVM